jgi:hypothetical protein
MADICHVYINPDKNNINDMLVTVHLMESGRSLGIYSKTQFISMKIIYDQVARIPSNISSSEDIS